MFPNLDLYEAARPVLASLRQTTGETVQMGVLDHLDVVYVERLGESADPADIQPHRAPVPGPATSTGKVLLAHLPADVLQARLPRLASGAAARPYTIIERGVLQAELRRVVERGGRRTSRRAPFGAASVAAPIRDQDGTVIAAISVVGPISRARHGAATASRGGH